MPSGAEIDAIDPLRYLALIACQRGEFERAAAFIADIFDRLGRRGGEAAIANGLADCGILAAFRGDATAAGYFFGAAARLLEQEGGRFSLPARDIYERAEEAAAQALDTESWRRAYAAGKGLP